MSTGGYDDDDGGLSSPDPLTQTLDFIATGPPQPFLSSAHRPRSRPDTTLKRAPKSRDRVPLSRTRHADDRDWFGSARSIRPDSPRKQMFELDVGPPASPQRIVVTVEAGDGDGDATFHENTRRQLFADPHSSPAKRRARARSVVRDGTTTTTVPLRDIDTPRKRGRPRGSGTPHATATRKRQATPRRQTPARPRRGATEELEDDEDIAAFEQGTPTPRRPRATRSRTRSRSPQKSRAPPPKPSPEPEPEIEMEPSPEPSPEPFHEPELEADPENNFDDPYMSSRGPSPLLSAPSRSPSLIPSPSPARSPVRTEAAVLDEVDFVEYNEGPDFEVPDESYFFNDEPLEADAPPVAVSPVPESPRVEETEEPAGDLDDIWMAEMSPPKRRMRGQDPGESSGVAAWGTTGTLTQIGELELTRSPASGKKSHIRGKPRRPSRRSQGLGLIQEEESRIEEAGRPSPRTLHSDTEVARDGSPTNRRQTETSPVPLPRVPPEQQKPLEEVDHDHEDGPVYDDFGGGGSDYSDEDDGRRLRDNDTVAHNEDFTMIDLSMVPSFQASFHGKTSVGPVDTEELNDSSKLIVDRAVDSIKEQALNEVESDGVDLADVSGLDDTEAVNEIDGDVEIIDVEPSRLPEAVHTDEPPIPERSLSLLPPAPSVPIQPPQLSDNIQSSPIQRDPSPPPLESVSHVPPRRPIKTPVSRKIKELPLSSQLFAAMSARKPIPEPPAIPQRMDEEGEGVFRASNNHHLQRSVFEEGISEFPSTILGANTPYPPRTATASQPQPEPEPEPEQQSLYDTQPSIEDEEPELEAEQDEHKLEPDANEDQPAESHAVNEASTMNPGDHSSPQKLLTPEETPSPAAMSPEVTVHDGGGESRAEADITSSPPIPTRRDLVDATELASFPANTVSAQFSRPEIRLSSPPPPSHPEPEAHITDIPPHPNPIRRPTLSPIVRAGRTLQNILSDPISPVERRNSLGSPFRSSVPRTSQPPEFVPRGSSARIPSRSPGLFGQPTHTRAGSLSALGAETIMHTEEPFSRDSDRAQSGMNLSSRGSLSRGSRAGFHSPIIEEASRMSSASSTGAQPPGQGTTKEMNEDSRLKALVDVLDKSDSRSSTLNSLRVEMESRGSTAEPPRKRRDDGQMQESIYEPSRALAVPPVRSTEETVDFEKAIQPSQERGSIPSQWVRSSKRLGQKDTNPLLGNGLDDLSVLSQQQRASSPTKEPKAAHLSDFFSSPHPVPSTQPRLYPDLRKSIARLNEPALSASTRDPAARVAARVSAAPSAPAPSHPKPLKRVQVQVASSDFQDWEELDEEGTAESPISQVEQLVEQSVEQDADLHAAAEAEAIAGESSPRQESISSRGSSAHPEQRRLREDMPVIPVPSSSHAGGLSRFFSPIANLPTMPPVHPPQVHPPTPSRHSQGLESPAPHSLKMKPCRLPDKSRPQESEDYSLLQNASKADRQHTEDPQTPQAANLTEFFSSPHPPAMTSTGVPVRKDPAPTKFSTGQAPHSNSQHMEVRALQPVLAPPDNGHGWRPRIPQKNFQPSSPKQNLFGSDDRKSSRVSATSPVSRNPSTPPDQTITFEDEDENSFHPEPIPQKRDFTPKPGGSRYSIFHPDAAYFAEHPPKQLSSATQDESSISLQRRRNELRPLPGRAASPSKGCLRSPIKPKTPGRVVAFTSSTLSPLNVAEAGVAAFGEEGRDVYDELEDEQDEPERMDVDDTLGIDWEAAAVGVDESAVEEGRGPNNTSRGAAEPLVVIDRGDGSREQIVEVDIVPKDEPSSGISLSAIPPAPVVPRRTPPPPASSPPPPIPDDAPIEPILEPEQPEREPAPQLLDVALPKKTQGSKDQIPLSEASQDFGPVDSSSDISDIVDERERRESLAPVVQLHEHERKESYLEEHGRDSVGGNGEELVAEGNEELYQEEEGVEEPEKDNDYELQQSSYFQQSSMQPSSPPALLARQQRAEAFSEEPSPSPPPRHDKLHARPLFSSSVAVAARPVGNALQRPQQQQQQQRQHLDSYSQLQHQPQPAHQPRYEHRRQQPRHEQQQQQKREEVQQKAHANVSKQGETPILPPYFIISPPVPHPLSQTRWSKAHWLRLEQLVNARKAGHLGRLLEYHDQHHHNRPGPSQPQRQPWQEKQSADPGLQRQYDADEEKLERLEGLEITASRHDVCMTVQGWQIEVVRVFKECVGGWDEGELVKRVFGLMVGQAIRSGNDIVVAAGDGSFVGGGGRKRRRDGDDVETEEMRRERHRRRELEREQLRLALREREMAQREKMCRVEDWARDGQRKRERAFPTVEDAGREARREREQERERLVSWRREGEMMKERKRKRKRVRYTDVDVERENEGDNNGEPSREGWWAWLTT